MACCIKCGVQLKAYPYGSICPPCHQVDLLEQMKRDQSRRSYNEQSNQITERFNQDKKSNFTYSPPIVSNKSYSYTAPATTPVKSWNATPYLDFAEVLTGLIFGPICIYIATCLLAWSAKLFFWMLTAGFIFGREFPHWVWYWF